MRRLEVSPDAEHEIDDLLAWSELKFGVRAADRYRRLIDVAFVDLLSDPDRPGVGTQPGIPADLRLYSIRHSRARVPREERVGQPRHVIAFRFDESKVEIVHLLHDGMDLPGRLKPAD